MDVCALKLGIRKLYLDGVIDHTDMGGTSNDLPCDGDMVA